MQNYLAEKVQIPSHCVKIVLSLQVKRHFSVSLRRGVLRAATQTIALQSQIHPNQQRQVYLCPL